MSRFRVAFGIVCLLPALFVFVGCGGGAPAKTKPTAKKTKTAKPAPEVPPEPPIDPKLYSSVDEAMAAVVTGFLNQKDADINKAERWVILQGPAIAPQLAERVKNPSLHLAERISSCRVLAQFGPVALPTMLEFSQPETKPDQLRLKAVEALGNIKPPENAAIDRLVSLMQDKDLRVRVAVMRGLRNIGPPAKKQRPELVEKLQGVLNSMTEDDTVRVAAKDALKKIEPRQGFSGMGKIEESEKKK